MWLRMRVKTAPVGYVMLIKCEGDAQRVREFWDRLRSVWGGRNGVEIRSEQDEENFGEVVVNKQVLDAFLSYIYDLHYRLFAPQRGVQP